MISVVCGLCGRNCWWGWCGVFCWWYVWWCVVCWLVGLYWLFCYCVGSFGGSWWVVGGCLLVVWGWVGVLCDILVWCSLMWWCCRMLGVWLVGLLFLCRREIVCVLFCVLVLLGRGNCFCCVCWCVYVWCCVC